MMGVRCCERCRDPIRGRVWRVARLPYCAKCAPDWFVCRGCGKTRTRKEDRDGIEEGICWRCRECSENG